MNSKTIVKLKKHHLNKSFLSTNLGNNKKYFGFIFIHNFTPKINNPTKTYFLNHCYIYLNKNINIFCEETETSNNIDFLKKKFKLNIKDIKNTNVIIQNDKIEITLVNLNSKKCLKLNNFKWRKIINFYSKKDENLYFDIINNNINKNILDTKLIIENIGYVRIHKIYNVLAFT